MEGFETNDNIKAQKSQEVIKMEDFRYDSSEWCKAQSRAYHRIYSFLLDCYCDSSDVFFLTGSSPSLGDWLRIRDHLKCLRQAIQRKYDCKVRFALVTDPREGKFGVWHMVMALVTSDGHKIEELDLEWLRDTWKRIHHIRDIDVRRVTMRDRSMRRLAGYLADHCDAAKLTFSRNFMGFPLVKTFKAVYRYCRSTLHYSHEVSLKFWNNFLRFGGMKLKNRYFTKEMFRELYARVGSRFLNILFPKAPLRLPEHLQWMLWETSNPLEV